MQATGPSTAPCTHGVRRVAYLAMALAFLVLGAVGIVIPGLPTTPFLLLASYFLARSWPRMNCWLLRSRIFGPILKNWQQHRAVTRRVKITAMAMVAVAVAVIVLATGLPPVAVAGVAAASMVGLATIYRLPTRCADGPSPIAESTLLVLDGAPRE